MKFQIQKFKLLQKKLKSDFSIDVNGEVVQILSSKNLANCLNHCSFLNAQVKMNETIILFI